MAKYNFLPKAFIQGEFTDFENAKVSVATHAMHYGTAAFGGMRGAFNPQDKNEVILFRIDKHAKRLAQSAKFLNYPDLTAEKIQQTIIDFVKVNKPKNSFYIRPLVYISDLGISPRIHNAEKDMLIYGLELGNYLSPEGVNCTISSWYRQEDRSVPLRGKISGAYITSSLAKTEAIERGFDESILMNTKGKVSEASGMNVFIVRDGKIITPGVNEDILEGITRDSILQIARDMNYEVEIRQIDKSELFIADEVFLSGTAAKIAPVKKIENYTLSDNREVSQVLSQKMSDINLGKDAQYEHWLTRIKIDN